jgi:hypothetical protein
MPKNLRKIIVDFGAVMKLCLKVQGSAAYHSPCEGFAYLPFHKSQTLELGRVFWETDEISSNLRVSDVLR